MYHYPDGENHKKERYMDRDMKRPREIDPDEIERDDTNSSDAFVHNKRMKVEDAEEGFPTMLNTSDYEEIRNNVRVQEENAEQIQQEFEECLKDIKQDEKENIMSNTSIEQVEGANNHEDEDETAEDKEEEVWWQKFDEKKESEDNKEDEISIIDNGNDATQSFEEGKEDYNDHTRLEDFGNLT